MRNNLPILLEDDPQISQAERVQRCFSEMNAAFNTAERIYDEPYNDGFRIIANTFCDTIYVPYYDHRIYGIAYDGCVTDNEREYIRSLMTALNELIELAFEPDGMRAKDGITYDNVRESIREFLDSWCSVDNIGSSPISLLEPARILS
ncbi:MAG: hypothetical protein HFE63_04785 [Clostridiales bacterium]|nr:hypothetical protein [Clostridiales bacterium]